MFKAIVLMFGGAAFGQAASPALEVIEHDPRYADPVRVSAYNWFDESDRPISPDDVRRESTVTLEIRGADEVWQLQRMLKVDSESDRYPTKSNDPEPLGQIRFVFDFLDDDGSVERTIASDGCELFDLDLKAKRATTPDLQRWLGAVTFRDVSKRCSREHGRDTNPPD